MSNIGNALREARSKKAITLEEVHGKIKIHPRVLQLLEENRFEKLPGPVYVKSFLRSYAEFLEIDPENISTSYESVGRREPVVVEPSLFLRTPEEKKREADPLYRYARIGVIAAAVLAGILIVGFLWSKTLPALTKSLQSKKSVPVTSKESAPPVKKMVKPAVKPEAPAPRAVAVEKPRDPSWLMSAEEGDFPMISKGTPLELRIKAMDNVWLKITADGEVLFQTILSSGGTQVVKAQNNIEIWTGNSSNMELTLNRRFLGSPGKGVAKKILISREGVKLLQKINS